MLTVDDYGAIRRARRDGMSIRRIARTFHHTRRKIRQILAGSEPRPYTRAHDRPAPVLGPFHPVIDRILIDDEAAPPKQRHTAAQVFRRLRDEPETRTGMGRSARRLAETQFARERLVDEIERALRSAIEEGRSREG